MKKLLNLCSALFILCFTVSCQNNSCGAIQTAAKKEFQSCEIINGDTVNLIDKEGRKQGVWYLMKKDSKSIFDTVVYKDDVEIK